MSYSSVTREWGTIPKSQTFELLDLQKSSDGVQGIQFYCNELFVSVTEPCYATIAETGAEAEEKFTDKECILLSSGASGSFFFESGKSLWLLNSVDSEKTESINVARYKY